MKAIYYSFFVVFLSAVCAFAAPVQEKQLNVTGYGITPAEAITDGLVQAVGQLNGVSLTSDQIIRQVNSEISASNAEGWKNEFSSNVSLKKFIRTSTHGKLSGYTLLSVDEAIDGYQALLQVVYHDYEESTISVSTGRRALAVVPFNVGRNSFMLLGDSTPANRVEMEFRNRLIDLFTHSRRLNVMDRDYGEAFEAEKAIWLSDDAKVGETARLGNVKGVDYLVVGTIKSMQSTRHVETLQLTGETLSSYSGVMQVDYKIILAATRQVKWSNTLRVKFDNNDIVKMLNKFGSSQTGMIHSLAEKIVQEAIGNIYPMRVVSLKGKMIVVNQGGDSLKKGQILDVFFVGEEMFDPYTNESLGQMEEHAGRAKVVRSTAKVSYLKFIEGDIDMVDVGAIVRP